MIDHKINNLSEKNDVYSREYIFSDVRKRIKLKEQKRKQKQ